MSIYLNQEDQPSLEHSAQTDTGYPYPTAQLGPNSQTAPPQARNT